MNNRTILFCAVAAMLSVSCGEKPYGAIPTPQQLEWQDMEMNMFCHFGPNTFTGREWGDGTEPEDIFNPTELDCRQWARTAKAAGFKGIIITAKHHDGFCLWPNPAAQHTVAQSSWRGGEGDVLRELSDACREEGLKFGIYISPWDRNDPHYGTPEYNEVFAQTLSNALSSYGPVFEQWFDGACGEGPNGRRQEYDWELFHEAVFSNQPQAVVFSNVGPGCRWVGNEEGSTGETCWATFTPSLYGATHEQLPGDYGTYLNQGDAGGEYWIPAETDVSIRPGWFWKESETARLKSVDELLKIYYESVGRNSLLLLNVPPDNRGLIPRADSIRLMEFRAALDRIFSSDLGTGAQMRRTRDSWTLTLRESASFNRVVLSERIALGQRISEFNVEALVGGEWKEIARGTTIGRKRILLVEDTEASAVRVNVTGSLARPLLKGVSIYYDDVYRAAERVRSGGDVHPAGESIVLDLGAVRDVAGIQYTPIYRGEGGVITSFRLEISDNGSDWALVKEDIFQNIVNNPVRCEVPFQARGRYIKLTPTATSNGESYGLSSFEVLL